MKHVLQYVNGHAELDLQLLMQSLPITTNIVSLNCVGGKAYLIKLRYIKFELLGTGRWYLTCVRQKKNMCVYGHPTYPNFC